MTIGEVGRKCRRPFIILEVEATAVTIKGSSILTNRGEAKSQMTCKPGLHIQVCSAKRDLHRVIVGSYVLELASSLQCYRPTYKF